MSTYPKSPFAHSTSNHQTLEEAIKELIARVSAMLKSSLPDHVKVPLEAKIDEIIAIEGIEIVGNAPVTFRIAETIKTLTAQRRQPEVAKYLRRLLEVANDAADSFDRARTEAKRQAEIEAERDRLIADSIDPLEHFRLGWCGDVAGASETLERVFARTIPELDALLNGRVKRGETAASTMLALFRKERREVEPVTRRRDDRHPDLRPDIRPQASSPSKATVPPITDPDDLRRGSDGIHQPADPDAKPPADAHLATSFADAVRKGGRAARA